MFQVGKSNSYPTSVSTVSSKGTEAPAATEQTEISTSDGGSDSNAPRVDRCSPERPIKHTDLNSRRVSTKETPKDPGDFFNKCYSAIDRLLRRSRHLAMSRDCAERFIDKHGEHFIIGGGERDRKAIRDKLIDIATTPPGAKLLRDIVKYRGKIIIEQSTSEQTTFRSCKSIRNEGLITLNTCFDSYFNGVDRTGMPVIIKDDSRVNLFHELLHFHKRLTKPSSKVAGSSEKSHSAERSLIDPSLKSHTEQLVILGYDSRTCRFKLLSENAFRIAFLGHDGPLRIDHMGAGIPNGTKPTPGTFAQLRAGFQPLCRIVDSNPQILNRTYPTFYAEGPHVRLFYPLTIAILKRNFDSAFYMLQCPEIDVNNVDDYGLPPLGIAFNLKHGELYHTILDHPTFKASKTLPLSQWKRFLEQVQLRAINGMPPLPTPLNTNEIELSYPVEGSWKYYPSLAGSSPLDERFEAFRSQVELLIGSLSNLTASVKHAIHCAESFALIQADAVSECHRQYGADFSETYPEYAAYLTKADMTAFINCFISAYIPFINAEMRHSLLITANSLDRSAITKLTRKMAQTARAEQIEIEERRFTEKRSEDGRQTDFAHFFKDDQTANFDMDEYSISTIRELTLITNPKIHVDDEMAKGVKSFSQFLQTHYLPIKLLIALRDAIIRHS